MAMYALNQDWFYYRIMDVLFWGFERDSGNLSGFNFL